MSAISTNLLHFLARSQRDQPFQQFEIFKKIIINGFKASKSYTKYESGTYITNNVVCFTDLPLSQSSEHSEVYGKFAIGVKKSYVKNIGGNPVRYLVNNIPLSNLPGENGEFRGFLYERTNTFLNMIFAIKPLQEQGKLFSIVDSEGKVHMNNEQLAYLLKNVIDTHSFDKETGDLGVARDNDKGVDSFYEEREWRAIPIVHSSGYKNVIEINKDLFFPIKREHINMVVVPNDDIRAATIEFFLTLRDHENSDLHVYSTNMPTIVNFNDLNYW